MSRSEGLQGDETIEVFTDGSCHPGSGEGAWAAIVLEAGKKVFLSGKDSGTTHQRMELTAAVEAVKYIQRLTIGYLKIFLYTDSQYLAGLVRRKNNLLLAGLKTKKKEPLPNADLVVQIFQFLETCSNLRIVKIPSHQKQNGKLDYNREVDKYSRKIVRESVSILNAKV
ncbi:MAG: RNase H family protein [Cyclobacteriaceae bacterium]